MRANFRGVHFDRPERFNFYFSIWCISKIWRCKQSAVKLFEVVRFALKSAGDYLTLRSHLRNFVACFRVRTYFNRSLKSVIIVCYKMAIKQYNHPCFDAHRKISGRCIYEFYSSDQWTFSSSVIVMLKVSVALCLLDCRMNLGDVASADQSSQYVSQTAGSTGQTFLQG